MFCTLKDLDFLEDPGEYSHRSAPSSPQEEQSELKKKSEAGKKKTKPVDVLVSSYPSLFITAHLMNFLGNSFT